MIRSTFKTNYFIYEIKSRDDGLYYIGAHHCRGTGVCTKHMCKYKGSSSKIKELLISEPFRSWDVSVLEFAADREELIELELLYIELHLGEPGCLNRRAMPYPSKSYHKGVAHRWVEMFSPRGVRMRIKTTTYLKAVQVGFKRAAVRRYSWLKHPGLRFQIFINEATIKANAEAILESDWEWGSCEEFDRINQPLFLATLPSDEHVQDSGLVLRAY